MAVLLIRYSEIGLKGSAVRNRWENRMKDNLMQMLEADGVESLVEKGQARFYITAGDISAAIRSVRKVFGVSSLSVAEELDSTDPEEICAALAEYSKTRMVDGKTFAVRARREGGQKYTSMDIARQVGDAIWDANLDKHPKVNLSEPDITFWVEVRPKKTYYFQEYIYAHAGLPLGTQGRVVAYVDDDRGLLSAWLMMKRGCRVYVVGDYGWRYFKSRGANVCETFTHSMHEPSLAMARDITMELLDDFDKGDFDRIYACYTEYSGSMSVGEPMHDRLIPFDRDDFVNIILVSSIAEIASGALALVSGHFTFRAQKYKLSLWCCLLSTIFACFGIITLICGIYVTYRISNCKASFGS